MDAETMLGNLLAVRPETNRSSRGGTSKPLFEGVTKKQSHEAQTIAANPQTRRYNRAKKAQGGDHGGRFVPKCQNDTLVNQAERLGKEHGVSAATIKRDGKAAAFLNEE